MAMRRLSALALLAAAAAAPETASAAVSASCGGALTADTNATGLGGCVATCIQLAAARAMPSGGQWEPGALGGDCATCAGVLTKCKAQAAPAGDGGWLGESAAPSASEFTCSAEYSWVNTTLNGAPTGARNTLTLRLADLCYPAECSDGDVGSLVSDSNAVAGDAAPAYVSAVASSRTCDLLGSFVNENFAWVIFAGGLILIGISCLMPTMKAVPYIALVWMLYVFTTIDALTGAGFLVLSGVVMQETDFPDYLIFTVLGVGVLQLFIALVLYCGGLKSDGTPCILSLAHGLAFLFGPISGVLGIVFQVSGKEMLMDTFDEIGLELAASDRAEIEDFMQTTHTLLVCAFFLMMGVHISTIPVSRSVRDYRYEQRDKVVEDVKMDEVREGQRYEAEKTAFVDKNRAKILKAEAKKNKGKKPAFTGV